MNTLSKRRNLLVHAGILAALLVGPLSAAAPTRAWVAPAAPAEPFAGKATITVTTTADEVSISFDANSPGSKCSLREAMQAMYGTEATGNLGCGLFPFSLSEFEIKFSAGGTYKITRDEELPYVNKKLTMDAPGVSIDGGSKGFGRHFGIFIVVGGSLYLKNMTIQNGSAIRGGAIWAKPGTTVVLDKMKFKDNDAAAAQDSLSGGAILNENGTLTVTESIFENNVAVGEGGAIDTNNGFIYKSKFIDNLSLQGGGAIHVRPSANFLTIHDSEFKQNKTKPNAFYAPANGYEERFDNIGGGAIQNRGRLILLRVTLDGNFTELNKGGGGLSNEAGGEAIINDTVFTKNRANAKGSGDNNTFIKYAFGGAIYNAGQLTLGRTSIHKNEGDIGGGIFNHKPGKAVIVNTTVSNNTGWFHGGVVNEHFHFDLNVGGAEVRLYHSTIAKNKTKNEGMSNNLYSSEFKSIWVSNSIVDTGCERTVYSFGHNLFGGACETFPAPNEFGDANYTVDAGSDLTNTKPVSLGLSPLGNNGGPIANFLSHDLAGGSYAISAGRNDQYGCEFGLVGKIDQIQNPRGQDNTACDIGAIEGESDPPKFESNPKPAAVEFPAVNLESGPGSSTAVIDISNAGGGALFYSTAFDGQFNSTFLYDNTPPDGTLFKNQHALITLTCTPPGPGNFWRGFKVKTNIPDRPTVYFKLHCVGVGKEPVADVSQEPGNVNMGMGEPGAPVQSTFVVRNPSPKALNVNYSWVDQGNGVWDLAGSKFAVAQAAEAQDSASLANVSVAITLQPGENLKLDAKCTPPGPGVFVNTLVLNTNDATNPTVQYDVACEGAYPPAPEKLQPGEFYEVPAVNGEGIAISPDGQQVVYGTYDNGHVRSYSRNASTGKLTFSGSLAATGMSSIFDLKYSQDGRNLYYTSRSGNGIVNLSRSANGVLSVSQVITTGTNQRACKIGQFFIFCDIGTMQGAFALGVSPDDRNVYVAGYDDGSLTAFVRNPNTGALSYLQRYTRTLGILDGGNVLGGANRVVVSPDGQNVYVTSRTDNTLSVFGRNADGTLVFHSVYRDNANGIDKLSGTSDLALSPDGKYLYATAWFDDAINIFKRGEGDGDLQLQTVITGVNGAYGIALSHDLAGSRVFLTLYDEKAVQVYGRDEATGQLSLLEGYSNSLASNIAGPVYIVPSPDDMHAYVSLYEGHGIRLFETVKQTPILVSISPASALAGSEGFTLTLRGARFYGNSTSVLWNGAPIAAVFISPNELQVPIPAANIASAGSISVAVRNSAPGGGDSAGVNFGVTAAGEPAVPSIESLDPSAAAFGLEELNVLVSGANFAPNSQVLLNNNSIFTLYVNTITLLIKLTAADLDEVGAAGLVVVNGSPAASQVAAQSIALAQAIQAGAASSVFRFETAGPGLPAVASISSLAPSAMLSGSAQTWVSVHGSNFSNAPNFVSVARWNGQPRESAVLSADEMLVLLTAEDLAQAGPGKLTILTAGAGESSAAQFTVLLPGENPAPTASSYVFDTDSGTVKLVVSGSDFVAGAQVLVNGSPRPTTVIAADVVVADLTTADFNTGGAVQVANPGPGGGASNPLQFAVRRQFVPQLRK